MFIRFLSLSLVSLAVLISANAQTPSKEDRTADAAAIRAHIGSIFQAFIDWDVDKIRATHSEDWRGFLEGSRVPIKGIDEYMRANGIDWPPPANAPKSTSSPDATRGYEMKDFDVIFYGPELAVASFNGEFNKKTGNITTVTRRFRIMDVYAKRQGNWIQVASHTVVDPAWREEQTSQPMAISPQTRQRVLAEREKVWKAYFANDRAALEKLREPGAKQRAYSLYEQLAALKPLRQEAKREMIKEAGRQTAYALLKSVPQFGPVSVAQLWR